MLNSALARVKKMTSPFLIVTIALTPSITPAFAAAAASSSRAADSNTTTPIKHVIVVVGENRSFDHLFATYVPKDGEIVNNLLSEGIAKPEWTVRTKPFQGCAEFH